MKSIHIIDNFLTKEEHKIIKDLMFGPNFAWHLNSTLSYKQNKYITNQFTHIFYDGEIKSNYFSLLTPLFEKLKIKNLLRCKANLNPYFNRVIENGYHIDYDYGLTAVYYVNTNNGYTRFKKNQKIKSLENRIVIFPSEIEHTGTTCSNEFARCVINVNFISTP